MRLFLLHTLDNIFSCLAAHGGLVILAELGPERGQEWEQRGASGGTWESLETVASRRVMPPKGEVAAVSMFL